MRTPVGRGIKTGTEAGAEGAGWNGSGVRSIQQIPIVRSPRSRTRRSGMETPRGQESPWAGVGAGDGKGKINDKGEHMTARRGAAIVQRRGLVSVRGLNDSSHSAINIRHCDFSVVGVVGGMTGFEPTLD